jgi:DNA-binding NarL/FixJ family response regulator
VDGKNFLTLLRHAGTAVQSEVESKLATNPSVDGAAVEPADSHAQVLLSLVSDSRLLRDGLVKLLSQHIDVRVIGSYTGALAVCALPNPPGQVVVLDGGLGRDAVVAWAQYWRSLIPPAFVVIVELANDLETIIACIQAGAGGYSVQGESAAEVAETLTHVRQGLARCSPEVTAHLFARLAADEAGQASITPPGSALTPRELEVLRYIAEDYSNQDIADALVIEVHTVKHHVHSILEKLRLHHRWDAARYAAERGWLKGDPTSSTG